MNILDAFRSGRLVRRPTRIFRFPSHPGFPGVKTDLHPSSWKHPDALLRTGALSLEDVLANDWEVEPEDHEPTGAA